MTRREEILRRLHAIRRAGVRALGQIEDAAVAEIVRTAAEATRIARRLIDRSNDGRAGVELLNALDVLLSDVAARQERVLLQGANGVLDVSLGMSLEQHRTFGLLTPRRVLALSQQFNADFRPELRSDAYTRWIQRIPAETLAPESALRRSLADAVLGGKSTRRAVQDFLARSDFDKTFQTAGQYLRGDVTFKNLPIIEQKVSPLFRATRVIRTEMGRLDNVAGITFDQSAGLDQFIVIGTGDGRQCQLCADAAAEDPHPLDWWKANYGIAPFHPFCRDAMFGVPPEVDENLSMLALGELGAVAEEFTEA